MVWRPTIIDENKRLELIDADPKSKEVIKPILRGRDINRYFYENPNLYILLTKNGIDVTKQYPAIFQHLDSFGDGFKTRGAKGQHWTNLRACSFFDDFALEKIIWIELTDLGRFSLCTEEIYLLNSAYFLIPPHEFKAKYLLALLNSKLIKFYLQQIANTSGVGTTRWINIYVKDFPIPEISIANQEVFIDAVNNITPCLVELQTIQSQFLAVLQSKVALEKVSNKLQGWYELEFKEFVKELAKAKIILSLTETNEWLPFFAEQKKKAMDLKNEIEKTDKEIDRMVYVLYELTEEEVRIVEGR